MCQVLSMPYFGISLPDYPELHLRKPEAQTVKNLPAMQETHVRSLGWEDPLEKGMATHSSICLENPMDGKDW